MVKRYALGNPILEQLEQCRPQAKRELWAEKEPVPPWDWRYNKTILRQ